MTGMAHLPLLAEIERIGRSRRSEIAKEKDRRASNKAKVLARLQQGPATNVELTAIGGMRYGGRLFELRREGYSVTTEDLGGGLFRYKLIR